MEAHEATIYTPEALEAARRDEERRVVREGTELWRAHRDEQLHEKQREQCELRRMLANYWPWGRPGGGAPCASALRKRNVPLDPPAPAPLSRSASMLLPQAWRVKYNDRSYNSPDGNPYSADYPHYRSAEFGGKAPASHEDELVQVYRMTGGGVELAPLLTSRSGGGGAAGGGGGSQSTRHVATDATRPGYAIDSWRAANAANRDHVADLAEQIQHKQQCAMEERRREGENCRRHFDTWRRLWGRPGHGAPIDHARRRNNLHDILYRTAAQPTQQQQQQQPILY